MAALNHCYLLEQFLSHYRGLGVDRLWVIIHIGPVYCEKAAETASRLYSQMQLEPLPLAFGEWDGEISQERQDLVQSEKCGASDWIVWADIDEFHQISGDFPTLIEKEEALRVTAISGEMVDRISRTGELVDFNPAERIWSQFPIGSNITQAISDGYSDKVIAAKASIRVGAGHHEAYKMGNDEVRWSDHLIPVHHFKWDATVRDRLAPRVGERWRQEVGYWQETDRLLRFLGETKRLDCTKFETIDLGPPGYLDFENVELMEFMARLRRKSQARWRRWPPMGPLSNALAIAL
jgi:hypothetical protein